MTLALSSRLTNPTESRAHSFGFRTLLMDSPFLKSRLSTPAKLVATAIPTHHPAWGAGSPLSNWLFELSLS